MKKFLLHIIFVVVIPIFVLIGIYIWTDPFKTLRPFSLEYCDMTNRDYFSSELFLYRTRHGMVYDSYIFGSSRACGINSYLWKSYLPKDANQFVFQSWGETATGILQKMQYIESRHFPLKNAIILLDIPGSFAQQQLPTQALSIKDYRFSNQPRLIYEGYLFISFIKPSFVFNSIKKRLVNEKTYLECDTISNDWEENNRNTWQHIPQKDSLKNCSKTTRRQFLYTISHIKKPHVSRPVINERMEVILMKMKEILNRNNTNYSVVLSPGFYLTQPKVCALDLKKLQIIFGKSKVFDYTGKNYLTNDYNNFSDPGHFGLYVGYFLLKDICEKKSTNVNGFLPTTIEL